MKEQREERIGRMGNKHSTHTEDTPGATDLSRDGISHLKTQNTPNVKPRKHTLVTDHFVLSKYM